MKKPNIINDNLTYEQHMRINHAYVKKDSNLRPLFLFPLIFLIIGTIFGVVGIASLDHSMKVAGLIIIVTSFIGIFGYDIINRISTNQIKEAIKYFKYINKKK